MTAEQLFEKVGYRKTYDEVIDGNRSVRFTNNYGRQFYKKEYQFRGDHKTLLVIDDNVDLLQRGIWVYSNEAKAIYQQLKELEWFEEEEE